MSSVFGSGNEVVGNSSGREDLGHDSENAGERIVPSIPPLHDSPLPLPRLEYHYHLLWAALPAEHRALVSSETQLELTLVCAASAFVFD